MSLLFLLFARQFSSSWTILFLCKKETSGYASFQSSIRSLGQKYSCQRRPCLAHSKAGPCGTAGDISG